MTLSRRQSIGLALAGVAAGARLPRASAADAGRGGVAAGSVSWEGLGTTTPIMGRLGKPLGELLRVTGTTVDADSVRDKGEDDHVLLRVASIDGRAVKEPPVLRLLLFGFSGLDEDVPASTKLSLVGYEDGALPGIPRAAMKHLREIDGVVPAA